MKHSKEQQKYYYDPQCTKELLPLRPRDHVGMKPEIGSRVERSHNSAATCLTKVECSRHRGATNQTKYTGQENRLLKVSHWMLEAPDKKC